MEPISIIISGVFTVLVAIISGTVAVFIAKKKAKSDEFSVLWTAGEDLRREFKESFDGAKLEISELRDKIIVYEKKIAELTSKVENYETEIVMYRKNLKASDLEIRGLRDQIRLLENELREYKTTS